MPDTKNPFGNEFTLGKTVNISFADEVVEETDEEKAAREAEEEAKRKAEEEAEKAGGGEEEEEEEQKKPEDLIDKIVFPEDTPSGDEEEEEEEINKKVEEADDDFDYKEYAQSLIDSGYWEGVEDFDEMEVDKDTFEKIQKEQNKVKKSKLKEEVLSSLDESEKEYLDFKKNGGDLDQFYQSKKKVEQVTNFDISTDDNKVRLIAAYYRNLGEDDEEIRDRLENAVANNKLDKLAEKAKSKMEAAYKKEHEEMLEKQAEAKAKEDEKTAEYRKQVKEAFKSTNLTDSQKKTAVKRLTEIDEDNLTAVDKDYIAFRGDPEKAILLERFLNDPESFMEAVAEKTEESKTRETFIKIKTHKVQKDEKTETPTKQKKKSGRVKTTKNPFF